MTETVAVLGGGMVGVCCALELQRRGFSVRLIERKTPGAETSYGNAGVIARSSLMPINNPALWKTLPKLLGNRSTAFRYQLPYILANIGWATKFLANTRRSVFDKTTEALNALIVCSEGEHARLLKEAKSVLRKQDDGWLYLYRTAAGFEGSELARQTFDRFNVRTEVLDRDGLSDLEPSVKPVFTKALWIKDTSSINNPGALVAEYARLFCAGGGIIEQAEINTIAPHGQDWEVLDVGGQRKVYNRVVVALGPWAPVLMAKLGVKVPMGYERGYHMHYAAEGDARLGRPIYDTAGGYVLAPMEQGLRLTTGVELAGLDAPQTTTQLTHAETAAREAFPIHAPLDAAPWMGRRPSMPDSRPLIGAMPGRKGLWLAFGHQHIGFSTGPGTAKLLADLMTGIPACINAEPFAPSRFLRG